MDDADMATERAERLEPYFLKSAMKATGPLATGFCLHCDEPQLSATGALEARWCDAACRDDYQYAVNRRLNKK